MGRNADNVLSDISRWKSQGHHAANIFPYTPCSVEGELYSASNKTENKTHTKMLAWLLP